MSALTDPFLDDLTPLSPGSAVAAILLTSDARYLLQHRDRRCGIFFPDHWGFFGGAIEADDMDRPASLQRELKEELALDVGQDAITYFSDFTFDTSFCGLAPIHRTFFEIQLVADQIADLRLAEGSEFRIFTAHEALGRLRLAPYDAFALWMHANRVRLSPGGG